MAKITFKDLSLVDRKVLLTLFRDGALPTRDLADFIVEESDAVKAAIDNLKAHGLIAAKPGKGFALTNRGRLVYEKRRR